MHSGQGTPGIPVQLGRHVMLQGHPVPAAQKGDASTSQCQSPLHREGESGHGRGLLSKLRHRVSEESLTAVC